jgi:hypothetical protein
VTILTDPVSPRSYPAFNMASIYYSHPSNRQGILRAVLPSQVARLLLKELPGRYIGCQFPTASDGQRTDFGVLRVFEGEADEEFRVGFYVLDEDIMHLEEEVQSFNVKV